MHGGWGNYENITDCSKPCNGGTLKVQKLCNDPFPGQGGDICPCDANEICNGRKATKEIECNLHACPTGNKLGIAENKIINVILKTYLTLT